MNMSELESKVRLKYTINSSFYIIISILIILSFLTGVWAYEINFNTVTVEEERVTDRWTEETEFKHSVISEKDTDPYKKGQKIENNAIYYQSISDTLNGKYIYTHSGQESEVSAESDLYLRIRGVDYNEDNEISDVYWEVSDKMASNSGAIESGESQVTEFSINITELSDRIADIEQNQLESQVGFIDIRIIAETESQGDSDNMVIDSDYTSQMILTIDDSRNAGTFSVVNTSTVDNVNENKNTVMVEKEPPVLKSIGSILLLVVCFGLLLIVIVLKYGGYINLTDEEMEMINIYRARQKHDKWITEGEFPSNQDYEKIIRVNDLEGLVDVAIDTNKRVIEDEQLEVSTVLDGDYVYMYVHPGSSAGSWLLDNYSENIDDFDDL